MFPSGTVSTAPRPFGIPRDPLWRSFTARMIAKSDATVVPTLFHGPNSRLFRVASHLHHSLRLALLNKEFGARVDAPGRISVGAPIPAADLAARVGDPRAMMDFLRDTTYALSPEPVVQGYGFDFEQRYKALTHGDRHIR